MSTPKPHPPAVRVSWLLHIWKEEISGYAPVWRASVTLLPESKRLGFPHPEAALAFLNSALRDLQNVLPTGNDGDE